MSGFMQLFVAPGWTAETENGETIVWEENSDPVDSEGNLIAIDPTQATRGFVAGYSAPGYMDQTDLTFDETAEGAVWSAFDLFGEASDGDGPTDDEIECAILIDRIRDSK